MSESLTSKISLKGIGKRKTSVANVILVPGTGKLEINKRASHEFFKSLGQEKDSIKNSLIYLKCPNQFDVLIRVEGGGLMSQLQASQLGVSKALSKIGSQEKQILSKNGFLYRDSRIKERRKYGLRKARKAPQYSKR